MFSKRKTNRSTADCSAGLERLRAALDACESVVVGAGAGLSTSAGFVYDGARFHAHFADFEAKYGFHDMYSGGFYPYAAPEEHWAFWSRNILLNRYTDAPKPVYESVLALLRDKDYFVLTTNVDHCFQKAGFDKTRLFYTQGDYGLFQCGEPCCQETFDNERAIRQMASEQREMRISSALIPRCPHCGKPMALNLRSDDRFVEDAGWRLAAGRYADFLKAHIGGRILFLELGVGYNTPGIIKYPFWQMTAQNPYAVYACVNFKEAACFEKIEKQSICINGDVGDIIEKLK